MMERDMSTETFSTPFFIEGYCGLTVGGSGLGGGSDEIGRPIVYIPTFGGDHGI